MVTSELLKQFNINSYGQYEYLNLKEARFSKSKNILKLIFLMPDKDYILFTKEQKMETLLLIGGLLPETVLLNIDYESAYYDYNIVKNEVLNIIESRFAIINNAILSSDIDVNIDDSVIYIDLNVEKKYINFMKETNAEDIFKTLINKRFLVHCIVNINVIENRELLDVEVQVEEFVTSRINAIEVKPDKGIVGVNINTTPKYISSLKSPSERVTACGIVGKVDVKEITSKKKPTYVNKQKKEVANTWDLYSFIIDDTTSSILVKIFCRPDALGIKHLKSGMEVMISGRLEMSNFTNALEIMADKIITCTINYDSIVANNPEFIQAKSKYECVFPQKYYEKGQQGLFDIKDTLAPFLNNKTFVVFDLETTGLKAYIEEIIEIGAVKIVNGEIIETFSSFVNPKKLIPTRITEITGITSQDVVDAYTIDKVLPDFYKFTRGAILVAQNASFDMGFIQVDADKYKYKFDNEVMDTLVLARRFVNTHNHKLETLCKHFGIDLTNAHRAMHDAVATAKLFKILAKNL